jgi:hypothetical protein
MGILQFHLMEVNSTMDKDKQTILQGSYAEKHHTTFLTEFT